MYKYSSSRIYGSGIDQHLKNEKIFQPVFRKKSSNRLDPESSKVLFHETPETKVKHLLDKAFKDTKSKTEKRHKKSLLNNIDHSIPPTHDQSSASTSSHLNPIVSAHISGEVVSQQPKNKKRKKNPTVVEKKEGKTKKQRKKKKKSSIFDDY